MTTYRELMELLDRVSSGLQLTPNEIEAIRRAAYSGLATTYKALHLLEYVAGEDDVQPLTTLVNSPDIDPAIRFHALKILCRHLGQATRFEDLLIAGLKGERQDVFCDKLDAIHLARDLLGETRSARAVAVLLEILEGETEHPADRQAAYAAVLRAADFPDREIDRNWSPEFDPHLIDRKVIDHAVRNQRPH